MKDWASRQFLSKGSLQSFSFGFSSDETELTEQTMNVDNKIDFYNALRGVNIGKYCTRIGPRVFNNCIVLKSVNLKNATALTTIDEEAFNGCTSLDNIVIPLTVTSIGPDAFKYVPIVHFADRTESAVSLMENYKWGAEKIVAEADYKPSVAEIEQSEGILTRGMIDFDETDIKLPYNLIKIDDSAFENYENLISIDASEAPLQIIGNAAFKNCTALETFRIPDTVTEIGDEAFYNCNDWTADKIPVQLTKIGFNAFANTNANGNLLNLPNTVISSVTHLINTLKENMGANCLYGYKLCYPADFTGEIHNWNNCPWGAVLQEADIYTPPYESTEVSDYQFQYNSIENPLGDKTEIVISPNVQFVGIGGFESQSQIISVKFMCSLTNGTHEIRKNAFKNCTNIKDLIFPTTLQTIAESAFENCKSLDIVKIPTSVVHIDSKSFKNAVINILEFENRTKEEVLELFKSENLDDGEVNFNIFIQNSRGIKYIKFKNTDSMITDDIGDGEYQNNKYENVNLRLGSTVKTVGNYAFQNCTYLESVRFLNPTDFITVKSGAFKDSCKHGIIVIDHIDSVNGTSTDKVPCLYENCFENVNCVVFAGNEAENLINPDFNTHTEYGRKVDCFTSTWLGCSTLYFTPYLSEGNYNANPQKVLITRPCSNPDIDHSDLQVWGTDETNNCIDITVDGADRKAIDFSRFTRRTDMMDVVEIIVIPDNVEIIPHCAYEDYRLLEYCTVPDSVKYLGTDLFGIYFEKELTANCATRCGCKYLTLPNSIYYCCYNKEASKFDKVHSNFKSTEYNQFIRLFNWIHNDGSYRYKSSSSYADTLITTNHYGNTKITYFAAPFVENATGSNFLQFSFSECSALQEFHMPKLKEINSQSYAFYNSFLNCTSLKIVDLPLLKNINTATDSAFQSTFSECNNSEFIRFELPELEEVNASSGAFETTFSNAKKLQSIFLPKLKRVSSSTDNIFKKTFIKCEQLNNVNLNSLEDIVNVGSTKTVFEDTFNECNSLTSITFPRLTEINNTKNGSIFLSTFTNSKIKSVSFPNLSSINNNFSLGTNLCCSFLNTFKNCQHIESIEFPELKTITDDVRKNDDGDHICGSFYSAFENCKKLTSVSFPKLTKIESNTTSNTTNFSYSTYGSFYNAFKDCEKLKSVNFSNLDTIDYYTYNNHDYSSKSFAPFANAFENCILLTDVYFSSLKKYSYVNRYNGSTAKDKTYEEGGCFYRTFANCRSLENISFSQLKTVTGKTNSQIKYTYYGNFYQTFSGCENLKSVSFPELISIEGGYESDEIKNTNFIDGTFSGCDNLDYFICPDANYADHLVAGKPCVAKEPRYVPAESSALPYTVTSEDNCTGLFSDSVIVIRDNVNGIERNSFENNVPQNDVGMLAYVMDSQNAIIRRSEIGIFKGNSGDFKILKNPLKFSDSIIPQSTFEDCAGITTVNIDKDVTKVNPKAFYGCVSLLSIDLENCEEIASNAFYGCSSLKKIELKNLKTVGASAFENCNNLSETDTIRFKTESSFGSNSFAGTQIKSIVPDKSSEENNPCVISLGTAAFKNCIQLETFSVPFSSDSSKINSIAESAFENCTALKSIEFTDNIIDFGDRAFNNCSSFKSLIIKDLHTFGSKSFANLPECTIDLQACENIEVLENLPTEEDEIISYVNNMNIDAFENTYRLIFNSKYHETLNVLKNHDFNFWGANLVYVYDNGLTLITEVVPDEIKLFRRPYRTQYYVGDTFDPKGIIIKSYHNSNYIETVSKIDGNEDLDIDRCSFSPTELIPSESWDDPSGKFSVTATLGGLDAANNPTLEIPVYIAELLPASITMFDGPSKTIYYSDDSLGVTGDKYKIVMNNGSEFIVTVGNLTESGYYECMFESIEKATQFRGDGKFTFVRNGSTITVKFEYTSRYRNKIKEVTTSYIVTINS